MCYEGRPGAQALCGCGDWTCSQFCYRSMFQTLKSFKSSSDLVQVCVARCQSCFWRGRGESKPFKMGMLTWGSAECGRGELHTPQAQHWALWQPGLLWPLTRSCSGTLCSKTIHHGVLSLDCPGWGWISKGSDQPEASGEELVTALSHGLGCAEEEEEAAGLTELFTSDFVIWVLFISLIPWMWNLWWNSESNLPPGLKCTWLPPLPSQHHPSLSTVPEEICS